MKNAPSHRCYKIGVELTATKSDAILHRVATFVHIANFEEILTMTRSLEYYYECIFWINYSFYFLYFFLKYIVAGLLWVLLEIADKFATNYPCLAKCAKITKPMRWLILQLFGGPLGIVEKHGDAYREDEMDNNEIPKLYIL